MPAESSMAHQTPLSGAVSQLLRTTLSAAQSEPVECALDWRRVDGVLTDSRWEGLTGTAPAHPGQCSKAGRGETGCNIR